MLSKFLIIISIILSPLSFMAKCSFVNFFDWIDTDMASSQLLNSQEVKNQWEEWNKYRQSSISSLLASNPNFLPIRDWNIDEPEINARAVFAFESSKDKILYQKNSNDILPIASLTKIMTAIVAIEHLDLNEITIISPRAVSAYGAQGGLIENESISIKDLFYAMLMESSNDAAVALLEACEQKTNESFISLMNQKAQNLGLEKTIFVDSTGLDSGNVSTAKELARLIEYSFNQSFIWQVLKTPAINLTSADGHAHHWVNTDKLLGRLPDIAGGKTGYTTEAQGCLALVLEHLFANNTSHLITIILGADDRFLETEKLIKWTQKAYLWK